jgi:sentrin-specific protease 1
MIRFTNDFSVEVTKEMLDIVRSNQPIDSVIIDLYLRYLLQTHVHTNYYVVTSQLYNSFETYDPNGTFVNLLHSSNPIQNKESIEKILVPVNFHNNHWILLEIRKNNKNVNVYDSIKQSTRMYNVFNLFIQQARNTFFEGNTISDLEYNVQRVPQQRDVVNCGLYTLLFTDYLLQNIDIPSRFTDFNSVTIRDHVLEKIMPQLC